MIIEKIPISQIKPAEYNPRLDLKPGDNEYEKIKRSIEEFDLVEPLVWNKTTGNLVGGHQRLKILKDKGFTEVDVSIVQIEDKNKEKALNIALNKASGEWDYKKVADILNELKIENYDLTLTGFTMKDLDMLNARYLEEKEGETDQDYIPENSPIVCKLGDIWSLGQHRLVCGDALNIQDVEKLMDGQKADLVFTDPPYNVDYEGYTKDKLKIKNDKMSLEDFKDFLLSLFGSYKTAIKQGASMYICHSSLFQREFQNALESAGFKVRCQIIWAKNHFAYGFSRYKYQHEPIFYCYLDGEQDHWYGDKSQSTLWHENKPNANTLHPTTKPVELIIRALKNSSKSGDIVLDLFGGSGSTMIGCEKTDRKAFLMEIDPKYCDVIIKRWEDFTSKKAVLNA